MITQEQIEKNYPRLTFDCMVSEDFPIVKGTWVTTGYVASLVVQGWSWEDILRAYPELVEEDLRSCMQYTEDQVKNPTHTATTTTTTTTVEELANKLGIPKSYLEMTIDFSQPTKEDTTLNVIRHGEYYYIQLGPKGEGGRYYFEMYLERWAADCTIIGLQDCWAADEKIKQNDLEDLFTDQKHLIRLCQVNRQYVRQHGLHPQELLDEEARRNGMKSRIDYLDGEKNYSPFESKTLKAKDVVRIIEL